MKEKGDELRVNGSMGSTVGTVGTIYQQQKMEETKIKISTKMIDEKKKRKKNIFYLL